MSWYEHPDTALAIVTKVGLYGRCYTTLYKGKRRNTPADHMLGVYYRSICPWLYLRTRLCTSMFMRDGGEARYDIMTVRCLAMPVYVLEFSGFSVRDLGVRAGEIFYVRDCASSLPFVELIPAQEHQTRCADYVASKR
jgi:hypothetical protein